MKKKRLLEILALVPNDAEIWLAVDREGNGYGIADESVMAATVIRGAKRGVAVVLYPGFAAPGTRLVVLGQDLEVVGG